MTAVFRSGLARNSLVSLAIKMGTVGLAFATQVFFARFMGAHAYGIYIYALTWLNVLVLAARLGTEGLLIRFVPVYAVERRWGLLRGLISFGYGAVGSACLALGLLAWLVLEALRPALEPERHATFLVALALLPVTALGGVTQSLLFGFKQPWRAQLTEPLSRVLMIILAAAAYWHHGELSAPLVMGFGIAAVLAASLVGGIWLARTLPPPMATAGTLLTVGEWSRTALPMLITTGLRLLLGQSDILLLGWWLDDVRAVGAYAVATRLAEMTTFGLQVVNMSLAPMISELHATRQTRRLQEVVTRSTWGIFLFTVAASLALALAGPRLLGLFGPDFPAAYPALLILLAGQTLNAATGSVGALMNMTGHQRQAAWLVALAAALTIGLAWALIPRFGLQGAACANAAGVVSLNLAMLVYVGLRLKINSTVLRIFHHDPA